MKPAATSRITPSRRPHSRAEMAGGPKLYSQQHGRYPPHAVPGPHPPPRRQAGPHREEEDSATLRQGRSGAISPAHPATRAAPARNRILWARLTSHGHALGGTGGAPAISDRNTSAKPAITVCQQPPPDPAPPVPRAAPATGCSPGPARTRQITADHGTVSALAGHAGSESCGPAAETPLAESGRQHNCRQPRPGPPAGYRPSGQAILLPCPTAHPGRESGRRRWL